MSKDIIPNPLQILQPPSVMDLGSHPTPIPVSEPGDVADPAGDLWLDAFGDRLVHGEMAVTLEQAQAAAKHRWEIVAGSERDGLVTVRRSDPHPEQD